MRRPSSPLRTIRLDDRTAVGAAIALRQHGIRALSDVMPGHIVRLVQGDVAVVHDGMGLVAHHVEDDLAAVRPNGAVLHPHIGDAALPQCDEPHRTVACRQTLLRLCLIKATAREDDLPHSAAPAPDG